MFTYLSLKNFKSFKDITINLQHKKDAYKQLVAVYGANGSGKSTLVEAFLALRKTMGTLRIREMLFDLLNNSDISEDGLNQDFMLDFIKARLSNSTLEKMIEENKMIGSNEPMVLEYGFVLDGVPGSYLMEFDNSNLIRERLEYKILKNRGCCFEIDEDKVEINSNIFVSLDFLEEIRKRVKMYWGKHSFLSILQYEMEEKSAAYIDSNISPNLMSVMVAFNDISYKTPTVKDMGATYSSRILENLVSGIIEHSEEKILNRIERVLNNFIVTLFDDVNKAFYRREDQDGKLKYSLFLNKKIDNRDFDIDFKLESTGTKEILNLLPLLIQAINGKCVIIDEFGNGIHDLLAARIIQAVAKEMKGQLILTTHNTMIMECADIRPETLYFIFNESTGKKVKCVAEIEERLHPNYNYRNRYFNNELYADGLPKNVELNFGELSKMI